MVVRLNSPDPVSLPKTVSINNTTGMIVDVGNVVWVYYWKNINDGFILPACMAVKAGVGEFINEAHNSERFNDYTSDSGIIVQEGSISNSFLTFVGKANQINVINGTGEAFANELRGVRNTLNVGLAYLSEEPFDVSDNYIEGYQNSLWGNDVEFNYIIGSNNGLEYDHWHSHVLRRVKYNVFIGNDNTAQSQSVLEENSIFGNSNYIDAYSVPSDAMFTANSIYGSSCQIKVFPIDYSELSDGDIIDSTHVMALGYSCGFHPAPALVTPSYGWYTLISGSIYDTMAHPNEIRMVFQSYHIHSDVGEGIDTNMMMLDYQGNLDVWGSVNSNVGADYAEYEEWQDGNLDNEDRRGLFVIEIGDKIRIANETDDPKEILGIVSSTPTICGDACGISWKGVVLKDVFGAPIMDEQEVKNKDGEVVGIKKTPVANPDYDPSQVYNNRAHRKEFTPVAYVGKVVAVDDGTCEVNGYCKPSAGGVATKSDTITRFRVRKRIDETHILVRVL